MKPHARYVAVLCVLLTACGDDDSTGNENQNQNNNNAAILCGNGQVEGAEECDNGAQNSDSLPDACRTDCTEASCGDGVTDTGEACDEGPRNADVVPDACRRDCNLPRCGDGVVDVGRSEECDDGNTSAGDGCDADCLVEFCGNGRLDPGEECDGEASCGPSCLLHACGNGIVDPEEECDDGGTEGGDGCSPTCRIERCGNGDTEPGEECDDGNNASGDGCSADCQSTEGCGNGYLDLAKSEECDDGNQDPADGCGPSCLIERCGNAYHDPGEECDDGGRDPGDGCGPSCLIERCGNGVIDPGEQCDDGNLRSQDGCSSQCAVEFLTWMPVHPELGGMIHHAMGYDALRERVVFHGGRKDNGLLNMNTWEYDGVNWTKAPTRSDSLMGFWKWMTYHGLRQRLMTAVCSVEGTKVFVDLWEYDGTDWQRLAESDRPEASAIAGFTYDGQRDRLVLFTSTGTYAWDGAGWSQIATAASSPPYREGARMVHDPSRDRVVLYAGMNSATSYRSDVWEFDGTSWNQLYPSGRVEIGTYSMIYHAGMQRVLVYGGWQQPGNVYNSNVYAYDGASFVTIAPSERPLGRRFHDAAYDSTRQAMVIFAGTGASNLLHDTWEFTYASGQGTWTEVSPRQAPSPRSHAATAHAPDQERTYLFGGQDASASPLGDTWFFDGQAWLRQVPSSSPSPRAGAAMAYDRATGHLVLFGGQTSGGLMQDTWVHDGATWSQVTTAQSPEARHRAVMGYHEPSGMVVLFGGSGAINPYLGDTWGFDGVTWTLLSLDPKPWPRDRATMWYEPTSGTLRLLGGNFASGTTWVGDLWAFDGQGWSKVTEAYTPSTGLAVAWDANLGSPLLFGGNFSNAWLNDITFEVTDSGPQPLPTTFSPEGRCFHAMVHHVGLKSTLLFGGLGDGSTALEDTWLYGYVSETPREVCDNGLDDDGDGLTDCADPDCDLVVCPGGRCVTDLCRPYEALCGNGLDDDGDGLVDCSDPDCDGRPCQTGLCSSFACM